MAPKEDLSAKPAKIFHQPTHMIGARLLNGSVGGVAVFVVVECTTRKPLAFSKQDPTFLKKGVADNLRVFEH